MRLSPRSAWLFAGALLCLATLWPATPGAADAPAEPAKKLWGLERRLPWTTSRVVGSPEPPPPYRVRRVYPQLKVANPIAVAHEPGTEALLLVHQRWPWVGPGRILRVKDNGQGDQSAELLSLDATIYGVAFHPAYAKNGYLYVGSNGPVDGTDRDIPGQRFRPKAVKMTRVSRFTVDRQPPYACDPKSEQVIIEWPSNGHNGGDLAFGPDGMLYISSGDGTSDSDTDLAGQDLTRMLSKVLRIDVDRPAEGQAYSVPPDNPFLKTPGARPETWAYGFRNPWRLSIDRKTGDVWVGNNGQDLWEQVYLVQRGANYGWSVVEGSQPFYPGRKQGPTPLSKPIADHHHSEARSLTGGRVYEGQLKEMTGAYVYGDWSTGKIWGLRHEKGKVTWHKELADTSLQITGFGTDSHGELLIVDFAGGLYQLEPTPPVANPVPFPKLLSETGLFASVKDHRPDPALIPYSVNAPLWSDGADKERFLALPGLTQFDFSTGRSWNFPEGTVLVKTFSLLQDTGNPASRVRIETRLLTKQQGEWAGYSYLWNDAQTEATLVAGGGHDRVFTIRDAQAPGGERKQAWHYPSRAECMVCHTRAANFVLGLNVHQMNKLHDYPGGRANQLRTLEHIGALRVPGAEHYQEIKQLFQPLRKGVRTVRQAFPVELTRRVPGYDALTHPGEMALEVLDDKVRTAVPFAAALPKRPAAYPQLVDPADSKADLETRVRSYLHANCAICHVAAGGGNAQIDLEFTTKRDKMLLFDVRPQHQDFGIPGAKLIVPGDPEKSILYQRVARRGPGQMPPLASAAVDREAVQLLRAWILGLKAD